MIVIIMRHGEAQEYSEVDNTRALTALGMRQCEITGAWLYDYLSTTNNLPESQECDNSAPKRPSEQHNTLDKFSIELALVSPYLRTQQSFTALAKHINVQDCKTVECIVPTDNVTQSLDVVHAYACQETPPKHLLLVSHMPLVSLLAGALCPDFDNHFFDTAEVLVINYDATRAKGKQLAMFSGHKASI